MGERAQRLRAAPPCTQGTPVPARGRLQLPLRVSWTVSLNPAGNKRGGHGQKPLLSWEPAGSDSPRAHQPKGLPAPWLLPGPAHDHTQRGNHGVNHRPGWHRARVAGSTSPPASQFSGQEATPECIAPEWSLSGAEAVWDSYPLFPQGALGRTRLDSGVHTVGAQGGRAVRNAAEWPQLHPACCNRSR